MTVTNVQVRMAVAIVSAGQHGPEVVTMAGDLERDGQPVLLVCIDSVAHEHPTPADALHLPLLSAGVVSSFVLRAVREPGRTLRTIFGLFSTPSLAAACLVRLPAATQLAKVLLQRGIVEVRGNDPLASRIASIVGGMIGKTPPDLTLLPVDWSRLNAGRVGIRWFARRINSIAAELSIGDDNRRVIVKRRQEPDALRSTVDRAAHEHRTLTMLAQSLADERLSVPGVLLFDEPAAMLVMERASGPSLESMFAAAAGNRSAMGRLAAGVRGAGAWLASMQGVTRRASDGRALLSEAVATAGQHAAKVAAGGDATVRRQLPRIVERLETLQQRLSSRPLFVTGHHGDYFPGNIFFDGSRVTVIDLESFRDGLWLEDAAYFLMRAEMLRRRFRLDFPDLVRQFFDGYGGGARPDPDALSLFTLTNGLRTLANGVGEDLPMPQRVWTRRTIRNAVLGAMRDR